MYIVVVLTLGGLVVLNLFLIFINFSFHFLCVFFCVFFFSFTKKLQNTPKIVIFETNNNNTPTYRNTLSNLHIHCIVHTKHFIESHSIECLCSYSCVILKLDL